MLKNLKIGQSLVTAAGKAPNRLSKAQNYVLECLNIIVPVEVFNTSTGKKIIQLADKSSVLWKKLKKTSDERQTQLLGHEIDALKEKAQKLLDE